jgi:hypothetical protein
MLLLAGCGKDNAGQPVPRVTYPALNESPPPPAPPMPTVSDSAEQPVVKPEAPPSVITPDSAFQRETEKLDVLKSLREYAAKAHPGAPFALTEKELEDLSKRDEIIIN